MKPDTNVNSFNSPTLSSDMPKINNVFEICCGNAPDISPRSHEWRPQETGWQLKINNRRNIYFQTRTTFPYDFIPPEKHPSRTIISLNDYYNILPICKRNVFKCDRKGNQLKIDKEKGRITGRSAINITYMHFTKFTTVNNLFRMCYFCSSRWNKSWGNYIYYFCIISQRINVECWSFFPLWRVLR